jgi:hypothetical protein
VLALRLLRCLLRLPLARLGVLHLDLGRRLRLLRRGVRPRLTRGARVTGATGAELAQLTLEVGLEPAAVLPLEGAQLVDPALQVVPLRLERAERLAALLLGLTLHLLGLGARVVDHALGLAAGLCDVLVGGLLSHRQDSGSGFGPLGPCAAQRPPGAGAGGGASGRLQPAAAPVPAREPGPARPGAVPAPRWAAASWVRRSSFSLQQRFSSASTWSS